MSTDVRTKRPNDRLDFDVDFGRRWLPSGDTIVSIVVTVDPGTDGTVAEDGTDFSSTVVKVWLTGGADGETAHVTVKATTTQGRVKEMCFKLRVKEGC